MIKHLLLFLLLASGLMVSAQGTSTATQPVTNILSTTASCSGHKILTWTSAQPPMVGLVWSTATINTATDPNAVAAANKTSYQFGWTGPYAGLSFPAAVENMTGLTCNTTYYVRAYVRDNPCCGGLFTYSSEVSFTTSRVAISTTAISALTTTTATSGGNVIAVSCGVASAGVRGICWNTAGTPTIADATATNGTGLGAYAANLTGLSPGTTYYLRAYTIGSDGNAYYGPQIVFKTPFPAGVVSPYGVTPEWYFGRNVGLSFPNGDFPSSGAPTFVARTTIPENNEASTSICYTNRAIALYSNSLRIHNSAGTTLRNLGNGGGGDNTCAGSSSGGALAFPDPAALDNQFIMFIGNDITGGTCSNRGINAYRFNTPATTAQYTAGPVAALGQPNTVAEAMAGGTDGVGGYWLVTHNKGTSNQYNIVHILPNGTVSSVSSVNKGRAMDDATSPSGLKFSPCQDMIAYAAGSSGVDVFYWDKTTGTIGGIVYQGSTSGSPNIEFSADGSKLYIGKVVGTSDIVQVDLVTGTTSTMAGTTSVGMTLGPDGQIYVGVNGVGVNKITNNNTTSPTISSVTTAASPYEGLINLAYLSPKTPTLTSTPKAACTDYTFNFDFDNYFGTNITVSSVNATIDFGDLSPVVNNPTFPLDHTFPSSGGPYTVVYTFRDMYCSQTWTATASVTINCPAPVTWFSVDATPRNGGVDVYWATASEENTSHFIVQRSADGYVFENIGFAPAAGNSNSIREYGFVDPNPLTGTSYYRIVQYDLDGQNSSSRVIPVTIGSVYLNVYPNPSSGEFNVDLLGAGQATFIITDALGRVVYEKAFTGENISTQVGGDLANGTYVLTINTNNNSYHQKLVKK